MIGLEGDQLRCEVERSEKWSEWDRKMPKLHFKPEWGVKIIPPFGGAIVRFTIDYGGKYVSVYFDAYNRLGIMNQPYWEVYDFHDGPFRFYEYETDEMMAYITSVLEG